MKPTEMPACRPTESSTGRFSLESSDLPLNMGCVIMASGLFCAADQPLLKHGTVKALAGAAAHDRRSIWRPCFGDEPGSPVYFPRWAFEELMRLPRGKGGGYIARRYPEQVRLLPVESRYELLDADDRETLALLLQMDEKA